MNLSYRGLVRMLDSKSLGLWAGLGTAAFVGYCIYFDSKRRSHPDFKRKLREKRKAVSKGQSKSAGPQLPDFSDQEAVQRFFLQEVQMGEELLATGDIQNGETGNMKSKAKHDLKLFRSGAPLPGCGSVWPTSLSPLCPPANPSPTDLPASPPEPGTINKVTII